MESNSELLSLVALYDDEDKYVKEAVFGRLTEDVNQSICGLKELLLKESRIEEKYRYIELIDILKRELIYSQFKRDINNKTLSLEAAIHLLSSLSLTEELDTANKLFDSDIMEFLTEISPQRTEIENVEIFNHIFFKRFQYDYIISSDITLNNSLFNVVVKSRKGNPAAVSIIYFMYAYRAGLNIFPLTFPGGFIPVLLNNNGKILCYLNIYKGGKIFLEDSLEKYFEDAGLKFDSSMLKIKGDDYLVAIYTKIVKIAYLKLGDIENGELFKKIALLLGENL